MGASLIQGMLLAKPARRIRVVLGLLLLTTGGIAAGEGVPSPSEVLGYRPGADFRLADWSAVVGYFQRVAAASPRVSLREIGRTTEDRPYIVAAISHPSTIADLGKYQRLQHQLTDPRNSAESEWPNAPIEESKAVVIVTCSIHSNETASTLMAMQLLYELAAQDDPTTRDILDKTIVLLVPSANPDGVDKIAHWYADSKGNPWEGTGLPELYHKYAGHDTNRDWFMLNLRETQLLTRLLYHEWFPTILYDLHQMGGRGARIFVPPFRDPVNPNVDARIHQSIAMIGSHMAADLATAGKRGILSNAIYDNWWNGGNRTTPQRHNIVSVLTEAASVRLATPTFVPKEDLRGSGRGFEDHAPTANFVDPWPGGWWRLQDIVDYELICARSLLTLAARYKAFFQRNLRDMGRSAIDKGLSTPPYGWIIPPEQRDPGTTTEMVRILHESGVEVSRARQPFTYGGIRYPAESRLLLASQPYRSHLKDMMEPQIYPAQFNAKGEAEAPYDVAGWTLPLQMGVQATPMANRFHVETERVAVIEPTRGGIEGNAETTPFLTMANRANDDFVVLKALCDAGVEVEVAAGVATESLASSSLGNPMKVPAVGMLRFRSDKKSREVLARVLPTVSTRVVAEAADWPPHVKTSQVRPARLGVFQPWVPCMDEGWTRFVLEKFRIRYTTLHNADIRAGKLLGRIETLVIPSIDAKTLREGFAASQTAPLYLGGLEREGAYAIRTFVEEGGTLICLENSSEYAIEELRLPVANVLKGKKRSSFFAPGSIVRVEQLDHTWLNWGAPNTVSAYFDNSLAFEVHSIQPPVQEILTSLRYANDHFLESGWVLGPEQAQGRGALVSMRYGKGKIILFAFPPQHRGQPHGTFRFFFNALLKID